MHLAFVTGTSRGLGHATARELLARGVAVRGLARSPAPPDLAEHPDYRHARLDLADLAALERRLAEELLPAEDEAAVRRVILVQNAAVLGPVAPVHALEAAPLARALAVNVGAPLVLARALLGFAPAAPLVVVSISSGAAHSPIPGWASYCASKAALRRADRALALAADEAPVRAPDGAPRDVRVITYAPGVVDTAMQAEIRGADPARFPLRERFERLAAEGALAPPEAPAREIAALALAEDLPRWSERSFGDGATAAR